MTNENEKAAEKVSIAYTAYVVEDRGPRMKPYWNPIGQLFLGTYLSAAGAYLAFAGYLTVAAGLSVPGRAASVLLLILETLALFISGYFAFEGCDVLCRVRPTRQIAAPDPHHRPMVCLQVPAFNEPPEMLIETIQ